MKQCTKCKTIKDPSEFYLDNKRKDKLTRECKTCRAEHKNKYRSTKHGFLTQALQSARSRARNKNVLINLDFEYIKNIATDMCPIFNVPLIYAGTIKGSGNTEKNTASLDRIIPDLGYVKGNVVFISHWANTIKSNATEKELYAVADWLHHARKKVLNAETITTTPIPTRIDTQVSGDPESGVVFATRIRQDSDDFNHHSGTISRQNLDHRAQASSGNSMGQRGQEMESSQTSKSIKDHGAPDTTYISIED